MEVHRDGGVAAGDDTGAYDAWRTEYRYGYKPARDTGDVDAIAREHGGPRRRTAR